MRPFRTFLVALWEVRGDEIAKVILNQSELELKAIHRLRQIYDAIS